MAIHQIDWRQLDDPCWGCSENWIDWTGCPEDLKQSLIEEYNMGCQVAGYQPKKEKDPNEKEYWYDNMDRNVDVGIHSLGWIGYPLLVYFILWPIFMAKGLPIAGAIFVSLACAIPWVIFSVLVGGALALLTGIVAYGIHYPVLRAREKKQAKRDEFDSFIKGCRNGRN